MKRRQINNKKKIVMYVNYKQIKFKYLESTVARKKNAIEY